jgi:surfeit locus 1 family protein
MLMLGNYQFRPRLWPTLVAILVFPCLIALGFWQLDRAEQKRVMHNAFLERQQADAIKLNERMISADPEELYWRHIELSGEFKRNRKIFLDNQVLNREAGYYVYALFSPVGSDQSVLINYGWIAAGADRLLLPEVDLPNGTVTLEGIIKGVPSTGITLEETAVELIQNNIRVQSINIGNLSNLLNEKLAPFIVRLEKESPYGLIRQWTLPGSNEAMHLGYAFQWFALAATLLVIFIVVNLHKDKSNE